MNGIDVRARLEADAASLRERIVTLSRQSSTGERTDSLADIARDVPRALDLKARIARSETYDQTIARALDRSDATQTVLTRLSDIAREFGDGVALKLDPRDPESLTTVAGRARTALIELGQLLNTQDGGEYLFGGSDFANPPVPNPEALPSSGLATQIANAVATLGGGNAAGIAATTLAIAQDDTAGVTPFSAFVVDPVTGGTEARRTVPADDGTRVDIGLFANRNAASVSFGETTGSWARDLFRGLASLAALTPASVNSQADFQNFAATIRDGLKSASNALGAEAGALGLTQKRLEDMRERHDNVRIALNGQLADIQEVDLADALSQLQQTRTSLEASYSAIAKLGQITLLNFLR